jgi:hypothetical protein
MRLHLVQATKVSTQTEAGDQEGQHDRCDEYAGDHREPATRAAFVEIHSSALVSTFNV